MIARGSANVMRRAALVLALAAGHGAFADTGSDELDRGIALFKAGNYADAVVALRRSYDAAPKPETLFALAQAERLSGDCANAAKHYHAVIEQISDFNVAKLVQQNLGLCEKQQPAPAAAKPEPAPAAPPAEPRVVTHTVTRDHSDTLAVTLATVGAIGLGAGGGLFLAGRDNRKAADQARTLDEHLALLDRADTEQKASYVAAGLGVAMLGYAIFRFASGSDGDVAVAPAPSGDGGAVWVTGRF